jgi:membrane-bound metal-dependent hydrolase YbcI (DUF457 family)
MLIACHLFFGALIGIILDRQYPGRFLLPACLLGSVLPDIIDKPLGYLIFPEIGDGRLIAHAIIGLILIGIISGILLRDRALAGALMVGVLSHQLLDAMWQIPVNWLYPLLGPFPVYVHEDYFRWGLMRELTTPSEWLFGISLILLLMMRDEHLSFRRVRIAAFSAAPAILLLITGR